MIKNADKEYYDNELISNVDLNYYRTVFLKNIHIYFNKSRSYIEKFGEKNDKLKCLELGAGSCTAALLLSKYDFVDEVMCLDISSKRMFEWSKEANKDVRGNIDKLKFFEYDFNEKLPFENQSIDIIFFDASLHHSRSIWFTLAECNRILKNDGLLIAQREAYVGILTSTYKINSLLKSDEIKKGVSENVYLRKQYEYYFKVSGFLPTFLPVAETNFQKFLIFLNGILFSKWVIISKKYLNNN